MKKLSERFWTNEALRSAAFFIFGPRAFGNHVSFVRPDAAGRQRRDHGDVFGRGRRRIAGDFGRGAGAARTRPAVSRPVFFVARQYDYGRHGQKLRVRQGRARHVPVEAARHASACGGEHPFDRRGFHTAWRNLRRRPSKGADGPERFRAFRLFPAGFCRAPRQLYRQFHAEFFCGAALDALPRHPARLAARHRQRRDAGGRGHAHADADDRHVGEVSPAGAGGGIGRVVEGLCDGREGAGRGGRRHPHEKRASSSRKACCARRC